MDKKKLTKTFIVQLVKIDINSVKVTIEAENRNEQLKNIKNKKKNI